jgi:hypothetical protein
MEATLGKHCDGGVEHLALSHLSWHPLAGL